MKKSGLLKMSFVAALMWAVTLSSCDGPYVASSQEEFLSRTSECFMVGHTDMISFNPDSVQNSYSIADNLYRCAAVSLKYDLYTGTMVETADDYYVLSLSDRPSAKDQQLTGNAFLCSTALTRSYSGAEFTVLKIEGPLFWLWCESKKLGVVVRIE